MIASVETWKYVNGAEHFTKYWTCHQSQESTGAFSIPQDEVNAITEGVEEKGRDDYPCQYQC